MYIRRSRLADIDIAYGNHFYADDDIRTRVPDGTVNFPAMLTIPTAVDNLTPNGQMPNEDELKQRLGV